MRKIVLLMSIAALLVSASLVAGEADIEADKAAIEEVIGTAYIKGIHTEWDAEAVRKGFHPTFVMLIYDERGIRELPIGDWIKSIERNKENHPEGPQYEITYDIPMVDVTGNAAVAKIELYKDGGHVFTDYMSLYKFDDGWKIVGKIFYRYE